jgi:hypothetical protein
MFQAGTAGRTLSKHNIAGTVQGDAVILTIQAGVVVYEEKGYLVIWMRTLC